MREFEGEAFERLLDEELGRSAAVKPQDGFEGRVLEQVRAADEERVGRGWPSRRDIGWLGGLADWRHAGWRGRWRCCRCSGSGRRRRCSGRVGSKGGAR